MLANSVRDTSGTDQPLDRLTQLLILLITAAGVAIVVLAFQHWIDFEVAKVRGTDVEEVTGISDGWFVAALGVAIVLLTGGVLFRPQAAPVLLPAIAVVAVCVLGIAGYDAATNWPARAITSGDEGGVLSQIEGDPTLWLYAIPVLAIVIAVCAAVVRGIQLRQGELDELPAD